MTPLEDRFWSKVEPTGFCWNWVASKKPSGYGQFRVAGKTVYAHRMAYELLVGPIREGLHLDHLCRNRVCVNPDHLDPVTPIENSRRGFAGVITSARRRRQTHCKRGHELTKDNQWGNDPNVRRCRTCAADKQRARRYMNQEEPR